MERAWKPVHEGDACDPRLRFHTPAQLLDGRRERSPLREPGLIAVRSLRERSLHVDPHRQVLLGGESGGKRLHVAQLPLLDVDDGGKCHGDRDLHDDHDGPHAAELQSAGPGCGLLQAGSHATRDFERGQHSCDRGSNHREAGGEQHRRGRKAEIVPEGEPPQVHFEEVHPPTAEGEIRRRETDHRRKSSEHERLGEELRDDPAATRSERGPYDELSLACRRPREQQKGDVATDEHEQHEREEVDREQDPTVTSRRIEKQFRVRRHPRPQMFVGGRALSGHLAAKRRQLRLCCLEGHAGGEQTEDRDGGTRTRRLVQDLRS